jgi:hypothetical protein
LADRSVDRRFAYRRRTLRILGWSAIEAEEKDIRCERDADPSATAPSTQAAHSPTAAAGYSATAYRRTKIC